MISGAPIKHASRSRSLLVLALPLACRRSYRIMTDTNTSYTPERRAELEENIKSVLSEIEDAQAATSSRSSTSKQVSYLDTMYPRIMLEWAKLMNLRSDPTRLDLCPYPRSSRRAISRRCTMRVIGISARTTSRSWQTRRRS